MQLLSRSDTEPKALSAQRTRVRRTRGAQVARISTITLCLLPCAILYLVFVLLPVGQAAYYSLYHWNGLDPLTNFTGLKNYAEVFTDQVFLQALKDNLTIVVLSIVLQLPLSLALALIVGRRLPGRTFFRTIFFLPYVLSEVVTGVIWSFIYRPDNGLLNSFFTLFIPHFQGQAWLGSTSTVLYAIFLVMIWKYFGFHLVLYLTGIQNIPDELTDAARIDGASPSQVTRFITIPLLGSTIRLTVFLSALGSLQYFDLIWIISNGGPVHASETMATYLVKFGFQRFELGYGGAIGVVMFLICFGFAVAYQRFVMRQDLAGSVTSRG